MRESIESRLHCSRRRSHVIQSLIIDEVVNNRADGADERHSSSFSFDREPVCQSSARSPRCCCCCIEGPTCVPYCPECPVRKTQICHSRWRKPKSDGRKGRGTRNGRHRRRNR